jgi:thiol:disulfide interchange protein
LPGPANVRQQAKMLYFSFALPVLMPGFLIRLLLLCLVLSAGAFAQNPSAWRLETSKQGELKLGDTLKGNLTVTIEEGWYLYSLDQPTGGPSAMRILVSPESPFALDGEIAAPRPDTKSDNNFRDESDKPLVTKSYRGTATFSIPAKAVATTRSDLLSFDVRIQLCNDTVCLPPKTIRVTTAGTEDVRRTAPAAAWNTPAETTGAVAAATTAPASQTPTDLWAFLLLAMGAGALSLLTPCVFPMIPITVSYFTNHAAGSRAKSVRLAVVYSVGIIATFTILGMLLAVFVGAAGIQIFSANPWINIIIAAIFLLFAFNLFGAFEIRIPTKLLTGLDALTRKKEGEGSGVIGALLMGLTFTLTSFTCTSPFIGSIMVSSANGEWRMPLLGMLAFSVIFALPFFVLALVPQWVAQLPRAGGWMNSVKVAMGFLEVAAAMKFISNVDLVWHWGVFTRDVVLAVWIALGFLLAIYLLGFYQLAHDSKPERLGALRLAATIVSLAVTFFLLTGLFGAKLGELESFLPPELESSSARRLDSGEKLSWLKDDYQAALDRARTENKRVFIDFTGYTCTNCRWMEANIFPKKEVESELRKYVLVQLYTDGEGEVYERQQQLEQDLLGTVALPYYAVVSAEGKVISSFPGLTRNVAEFVDFLRQGQQN